MVFPGIFESEVIEVCLANPGFIEEGKPACRGGKMDMDIPFKVSAKGVDGEKDTGKKTLFERQVFNDGCSDQGNAVHEIAVKPEKDPEFRRHGKGNVLPDGSGKGVKTVFNPGVSCLLATGRTKSGFTAMRDFHTLGACWADKVMVTEKRCPAYEKF